MAGVMSMLCQSCAEFLPTTLVEECSHDHQMELLISSSTTTCSLCKHLQEKFLPIEANEGSRDKILGVKLLWTRSGRSYKVVQARGQWPWHAPENLRLVTVERAKHRRQDSGLFTDVCRTKTIPEWRLPHDERLGRKCRSRDQVAH